VQERGKAKIGDKTIVDALDPAAIAFAQSIAADEPLAAAGQAALEAARRGRDSATPLRSKTGRTSWGAEQTEGLIDPGCELCVRLIEALVSPAPSPSAAAR
jgi:dihydroxyacetone kinase-like protein